MLKTNWSIAYIKILNDPIAIYNYTWNVTKDSKIKQAQEIVIDRKD